MPVAQLEELFKTVFTVDELKRFVARNLPAVSDAVSRGGSLAQVAFDVADAANRRGLIDDALFESLRDVLPGRRGDIDRVAAMFTAGATAAPAAPSQPVPPPQPTVAVPKWTHWVSDPHAIDELSAAQIDEGHGKDAKFDVLIGALGTWGNSLETHGDPTTRIRRTLRRLNKVRNLVTGEIPLERWLREAKFLARGNNDAVAVFNKYLQVFPGADVEAPSDLPPITEDEAKGMSLTPEAQIGAKDQTVSVGFLQQGWMASRSVARLLVPRFGNGKQLMDGDTPEVSRGTGWLIAPDLLITSFHVIAARAPDEDAPTIADFEAQAMNAKVEFDVIDEDAESLSRTVTELVAVDASAERDFAVLRLSSLQPARPPLRLAKAAHQRPRGFQLSQRVNVLQHPDGEPMRLGFRDNFVLFGNASSLSYLTDTDRGSSGAPVLDDKWQVVALHRGARDLAKPVSLRNHEICVENFGPTVVAILDAIKAKLPNVHSEIVAAQQALGGGLWR